MDETDDQVAIKVDGLTRVFGSTPAVQELSFSVLKGEVHGFLGPNGAGKSTTMRMIAGLLQPTSGSCWVMGQNVQQNPDQIKKDIGILLEHPPLYMDMLVADYLRYVSELHRVPKNKIKSSVEAAIEKLQLQNVAGRLIGNLSKGYKQRVGVAQAIVHNPTIVILDEPTVGLDPEAVIKMRELILQLAHDHTVLLSSHLLHEISLTCNQVTIISHGKLQATGPIAQIQQQLNVKNVIHLEVQNSNSGLGDQIKQLGIAQQVEQRGNLIKVYTDGQKDYRSQLAKLAVDGGHGLLMLKQDELSLEEIFISYTSGKNS